MDPAAMIDQLEAALRDVDAVLHRVDAAKAAEGVLSILENMSVTTVALSSDPLVGELGLSEALSERGLGVIDPPRTGMDAGEAEAWKRVLAGADVGVTSAVGIAAETGSVLLPPHEPDERAVSLLPLIHLVVIQKDNLVPDISSLMRLWQENGPVDGSAVFVTGPSRTADIEKELVLGVHGPQRLEVALLL